MRRRLQAQATAPKIGDRLRRWPPGPRTCETWHVSGEQHRSSHHAATGCLWTAPFSRSDGVSIFVGWEHRPFPNGVRCYVAWGGQGATPCFAGPNNSCVGRCCKVGSVPRTSVVSAPLGNEHIAPEGSPHRAGGHPVLGAREQWRRRRRKTNVSAPPRTEPGPFLLVRTCLALIDRGPLVGAPVPSIPAEGTNSTQSVSFNRFC